MVYIEVVVKLIDHIQQRYRDWQDRRFLKRHYCDNWRQYHHRYDSDISRGSSLSRDWYRGYEYVHCFESYEHYAYKLLLDYGPGGHKNGFDAIYEWCDANCQGKWRLDIHEVFWHDHEQDWYINNISGRDLVFFAFKDEADFLHFLLRWS